MSKLVLAIICVGLLILLLSNSQGIPFPFLRSGPPVEIKLHSKFNFSNPQITLFDVDGIDDGIEGQLVSADPFNACSPLQFPPYHYEDELLGDDLPDFLRKPKFWILLANNLNCDLSTKIFYALSAEYSGIIIGDSSDSALNIDPDFFFGPGGIVHVRSSSGNGISDDDYLEYESPFPDQNEYLGRFHFSTKVIFADLISYIVVTFFWIVSVFAVIFLLIWLFQTLGGDRLTNYWQNQMRGNLVEEALNRSTNVQTWEPDAPFLNNESCIICLDDFTPVDRVRILRCFHGFHIICVDPWILKVTPSCPICKQKLADDLPDSLVSSRSESERAENADENAPLLPAPAIVPVLTLQQSVIGF